MGSWERPKRPGDGLRGSSNVIPFARRIRQIEAPPFVLYLSNQEKWRDSLENAGDFTLLSARSIGELERGLAHQPRMVFVESSLEWIPAMEAIHVCQARLSCPVVLLQEVETLSEGFLKRAFEAGLSDTLPTPLDEQELNRMMRVLLHFTKMQAER